MAASAVQPGCSRCAPSPSFCPLLRRPAASHPPFNVQEKRKRDEGRASRGKSYVEEEKRRARCGPSCRGCRAWVHVGCGSTPHCGAPRAPLSCLAPKSTLLRMLITHAVQRGARCDCPSLLPSSREFGIVSGFD